MAGLGAKVFTLFSLGCLTTDENKKATGEAVACSVKKCWKVSLTL